MPDIQNFPHYSGLNRLIEESEATRKKMVTQYGLELKKLRVDYQHLSWPGIREVLQNPSEGLEKVMAKLRLKQKISALDYMICVLLDSEYSFND